LSFLLFIFKTSKLVFVLIAGLFGGMYVLTHFVTAQLTSLTVSLYALLLCV
jgi:hypothetical protein